jgi:flagellar hook-associated protein 1 FlgK
MAGAFSSINTALSALRYQQSALDIASTNIANASTDGYVRRRVVGETVGAAAAPAVWSRSNEIGSGVQSSGVQRMVDPLLDARVRREHGRQTYLDTKAAAMSRVETGINEPSTTGVAKAIDTFRTSLDDLNNAPNSDAARSQVLANANGVADAFNTQSRNLQDEMGDQRARVVATVQEINTVAQQLADTNRSISASSGGGSDTATLMDTRDQLALRLSELTGATATPQADGTMDITLGGASLVSGRDAATLEVSAGIAADGTADGSPVAFSLTQPDGSVNDPVVPSGGRLAASVELIDHVLPDYAADLDALVEQFTKAFNDAHALGFDASGAPGGEFFHSSDPDDLAGSLRVVVTDRSKIAVSSIGTAPPAAPVPNNDTGNAAKLADSITIQDGYQRLVNGFGSDVASIQRLAANQSTMTTQVDAAREQQTGVSLDEESVNMLMAQRSYEAAARVMTTVDEMLDTLINRTGLVGR